MQGSTNWRENNNKHTPIVIVNNQPRLIGAFFYAILFIALIFSVALATDLRLLNTGVPLTHSYNTNHDISYGGESWQKLDIYRARDADENTPVIVFFFCGGWSWGYKAYFEFL